MHRTLPTALAISFLAAASSPATIQVTEPFDYTVGFHAGLGNPLNWTTSMGSGSGIGWGGNEWFSHVGAGMDFGIAAGGHTGTFADSTGMNFGVNEWRQRNMTPVHSNTDGDVMWQYLTMSSTNSGTAGWLSTENSGGGLNYAVRIESNGTYGLSTEQRHLQFDTSTIPASLSASSPDVIVVRMENQVGTGLFDVSMWVNPSSSTAAGLGAADLEILNNTPFAGNRTIGSLNWTPGQTQIDNFILSDDYADFGIVPEPSAAILVGLGAFAIGLRRKRR